MLEYYYYAGVLLLFLTHLSPLRYKVRLDGTGDIVSKTKNNLESEASRPGRFAALVATAATAVAAGKPHPSAGLAPAKAKRFEVGQRVIVEGKAYGEIIQPMLHGGWYKIRLAGTGHVVSRTKTDLKLQSEYPERYAAFEAVSPIGAVARRYVDTSLATV